jgi:hypothetical protein
MFDIIINPLQTQLLLPVPYHSKVLDVIFWNQTMWARTVTHVLDAG